MALSESLDDPRITKVAESYFLRFGTFDGEADSLSRPEIQAGASLAGKDSSDASSTASKGSTFGDEVLPRAAARLLACFGFEGRISLLLCDGEAYVAADRDSRLLNQASIESLLSLSAEILNLSLKLRAASRTVDAFAGLFFETLLAENVFS